MARVLGRFDGGYQLTETLLYPSGMRLLECLTLRVTQLRAHYASRLIEGREVTH